MRSTQVLQFRQAIARASPVVDAFLSVGRVSRRLQASVAALTFVLVVIALGGPVSLGLIVSGVQQGDDGDLRIVAGLVLLGLVGAANLAWEWGEVVAARISLRMREALQGAILHASLDPPGIAHLDDPEVARAVHAAREQWMLPVNLGRDLPAIAMMRVTLIIASVVTLIAFPLGVLGLLAGRIGFRRWISSEVEVAEGYQEILDRQRAVYVRDLSLSAAAAKEIRLFNLRDHLIRRFRQHSDSALKESSAQRRGSRGRIAVAVFSVTVGNAFLFGGLAIQAIDGAVDLGLALAAAQIALAAQVTRGGDQEVAVGRAAERVRAALSLSSTTSSVSAIHSGPKDAAGTPREAIAFEDVSFKYRAAHKPVLDGLHLNVRAGEALAIVGLNGAGKTTLVKLLMRLYDPARGRILIDGQDIREMDVDSWRSQIAVLPQDFLRLEASLAFNVGFGNASEDDIMGALRCAGAERLTTESSLASVCAAGHEGGRDLSGGQWQKVALARVMLAAGAGAKLLVLDEPTASLDAVSEAAFFEQFLQLCHGRTVILLSHRFSTVRQAHRIAVLHGGGIVEVGTHDELLRRPGRYAEMFHLQASAYEEPRRASTTP